MAAVAGMALAMLSASDGMTQSLAEVNPRSPWAVKMGGADDDVIRGLAPGPDGSVFMTGSYSGEAKVAGTALPNAEGQADIVLARIDSAGTLMWLRGFGSTGPDFAYDLDASPSGDMVITGLFTRTVDFGGMSATSAGSGDTFTAKYTKDGHLVWLRTASSQALDGGNEVAVAHGSGRVHVIGNTLGDFVVDEIEMKWKGLAGQNTQDAYVIVYEADGRLAWAKSLAGRGDDMGRAVSVDKDGNVLVAGSFTQTASIEGMSVTSAGERDVWVAKFDPKGALLWLRRFGAVDDDYARGIDPNAAGDIYLSGVFSGSVAFGDITLTSNAGSTDVFVAKLSSSGKVLWATALGGPGAEEGCEIEVDAMGVVCAGGFSTTASFGNINLTSAGERDLFVARLHETGTVTWALSAGGVGDDVNYCIALDRTTGRITSAGTFFASASYGSAVLTSEGNADAYLWSLSPSIDEPPPSPDGGTPAVDGGSATSDGGVAPPARDDSGSGCTVARRTPPTLPWFVALAGWLGAHLFCVFMNKQPRRTRK